MITHNSSTPVIASSNMTSSAMSMSEKGKSMAAYFLRDKIYSNKVLACIREYICNAIDEHVKYGIKTPVRVEIDESDSSDIKFIVRDFAKGLDEDGIRNIFGMYFESTKTNTNNAIGGFGVGSKAAHCYTDTFFIDSMHNGKLTKYVCTLGDNGRGVAEGQIYDIFKADTTESGITITIPLQSDDVYEWKRTAVNFVKHLHHDANVELLTDGVVVTPLPSLHTVKLQSCTLTQIEKGTEVYRNGGVIVRMGNVTYSSDIIVNTQAGLNLRGKWAIDVPIGYLSIPISRESFENNPANNSKLNGVYNEVRAWMEGQVSTFEFPKFKDLIKQQQFTHRGWIGNDYVFSSIRNNAIQSLDGTKEYFAFADKVKSTSTFAARTEFDTIYIVPDNSASKAWVKRLENANGTVWWILETAIDDQFRDIAASCKIKMPKVKALKLPPLVASVKTPANDRVIWYSSQSSRYGRYTPVELVHHRQNKTGDLTKDPESTPKLNARVVAFIPKGCTPPFDVISTRSKTAFDELLKLGYIRSGSQKHIDLAAALKEKEDLELNKAIAIRSFTNLFPTHPSQRTIMALVKDSNKYLTRLTQLRDCLRNEQSLRKNLLTNHLSSSKLDRPMFRAIFKLKQPV
jgi:hypothetical protein